MARYRDHIGTGYARLAALIGLPEEVASEGCYVFDRDGRRYLDCGGYGVFLLGHRHPAVVAAVKEALDSHPMPTRLLLNPAMADAAEQLASFAPPRLTKVAFTNSGAEAVELAMKVARSVGHRHVVATANGFHGKTLGALSVTGRDRYRTPFVPLLEGVELVPYGVADAIAAAIDRAPGPAAVVLEPVQGEGGVVIPPPGYLRDVRAICDRLGALLILDEVQTGLGRLGTRWGADAEGVVPDILTTGKALGGGVVPVGAVIATPEAYALLDREPLLHTSTFAGNGLAMAAVRATLTTIVEEHVVERAAELGRQVLAGLRQACVGAGDTVVDVRGRGLLIAIQFAQDHVAVEFLQEVLHHGLIVNYSLNADDVVRLTPPATLSDDDVDALVSAVAAAVEAVAG